jgi:hypothetical protein
MLMTPSLLPARMQQKFDRAPTAPLLDDYPSSTTVS